MKESFWDQAKDRLYIFKKKKNLPPTLLPYTHTQFGVPTSLYPQLELKDNLESKKKQWTRELIVFEINNTQFHRLLCE